MYKLGEINERSISQFLTERLFLDTVLAILIHGIIPIVVAEIRLVFIMLIRLRCTASSLVQRTMLILLVAISKLFTQPRWLVVLNQPIDTQRLVVEEYSVCI